MPTSLKLLTAPVLVGSLALAACSSEPPAPAPAADEASPAEPEAPPADAAPKIASDEAVFEFGAIKASDSVVHVFKIKNEGNADLKIERVQRT